MRDQLRESSQHAVHLSKFGKINVRLISGDNLETAKYFALQASILKKIDQHNIENECMTAETFRERVRDTEAEDGKFEIDMVKFENVVVHGKLKVIARATPDDKRIIA